MTQAGKPNLQEMLWSISNKSPNVKNKKIGQEIEYKYEISLADIFRKYNRNMFCRMKKELWFKKICNKGHINEWKSLLKYE